MRKKVFPGVKLLILIVLSNLLCFVYGQDMKPLIGIHGGVNFSHPLILSDYNVITLIDGEPAGERAYDGLFSNFGNQLGFSIYLELNDHLLVGFLPEIAKYSYGYSSYLEFYNSQQVLASTYRNESKINLSYINFPLLIQYQIMSRKSWSPYLLAGISYGLLKSAQHNVTSTTILETVNGAIEFYEPSNSNSSSEFIRSKWNVFGGIGGYYDFKQFRIALDVSYWMGLHNIVNETNRYSNQAISGSTYDIADDIRLNHLVVNLSVLFPINKKINRGSLDCVVPKRRK